jgi:hypothetical protein
MARNPEPDLCDTCGSQFPAGQSCANCFPSPENPPPDLEEILRASQGLTPDIDAAIRSMAQIHADWRQAWEATDQFSSEEAFELVRILVAASAGGIRSLGLSWAEQRAGRAGPRAEAYPEHPCAPPLAPVSPLDRPGQRFGNGLPVLERVRRRYHAGACRPGRALDSVETAQLPGPALLPVRPSSVH